MFVVLLSERSRLEDVVVYVERLRVVSIRLAGTEQDCSSVMFEILLLIGVPLGLDTNAVVGAALVKTKSVKSRGVQKFFSRDRMIHATRDTRRKGRLETIQMRQTVPGIQLDFSFEEDDSMSHRSLTQPMVLMVQKTAI